MKKKDDLPEWFPFALVASFLIALGAGVRSNWKLSADQPKPVPPPPPPAPSPDITQAGMLRDWIV